MGNQRFDHWYYKKLFETSLSPIRKTKVVERFREIAGLLQPLKKSTNFLQNFLFRRKSVQLTILSL